MLSEGIPLEQGFRRTWKLPVLTQAMSSEGIPLEQGFRLNLAGVNQTYDLSEGIPLEQGFRQFA